MINFCLRFFMSLRVLKADVVRWKSDCKVSAEKKLKSLITKCIYCIDVWLSYGLLPKVELQLVRQHGLMVSNVLYQMSMVVTEYSLREALCRQCMLFTVSQSTSKMSISTVWPIVQWWGHLLSCHGTAKYINISSCINHHEQFSK